MKITKRVLAVLLALTLGLALLAPAAAAIGESPVIVKDIVEPTPGKREVQISSTSYKLALEVDARLPEGAEGPLRYEWYEETRGAARYGNPINGFVYTTNVIEGQTGAKATISLSKEDAAKGAVYKRYYVKVSYTYMDNGQERTASAVSGKKEVSYHASLWDSIVGMYSEVGSLLSPASAAWEKALGVAIAVFGTLLLPILAPVMYGVFYFDAVKAASYSEPIIF